MTQEFTVADVGEALARKRELGQPESIEWVHETTPSLLDAARGAGLEVLEAPLMVLDRSSWRALDAPSGITLRVLDADDPLAESVAVQHVGFGVAGTAPGPQGHAERNAAVEDDHDFLRERMRRGLTVTAVAEGEYGVVAAGAHQPVGGVSEIVGVATLPVVRRQGLGGAVTGALVEDALARGVETTSCPRAARPSRGLRPARLLSRVGTACIVG